MNQLNVIQKTKSPHLGVTVRLEKKRLSKRHRKSGVISTDSQSQKTDSESDRAIPSAIDAEQAELSDPATTNQQSGTDVERENESVLAPVFNQENEHKDDIDRGH